MANEAKISDLPNAAALTGTEPVETIQAGVSVQTTTLGIAALGTDWHGTDRQLPATPDRQVRRGQRSRAARLSALQVHRVIRLRHRGAPLHTPPYTGQRSCIIPVASWRLRVRFGGSAGRELVPTYPTAVTASHRRDAGH